MPEETHQPQGNRGRSRRERVEIARSRDILDVANELNMESLVDEAVDPGDGVNQGLVGIIELRRSEERR